MQPLTKVDVFLAALAAMSPFLLLIVTLHLQNRATWNKLKFWLSEYGFHDHGDLGGDSTVLLKGNIRRAKNGSGR